MSMLFYPTGWELAVDNPGYGELIVIASQSVFGLDEDWECALYGAAIGEFLDRVTSRALSLDQDGPRRTLLPPFVTVDVARALLPALQRAVVLATAGTDRYERVFPDSQEPPAEPLCARCHLGTPYASTPTTSDWCAQYGHRPFGSLTDQWDFAQERYRLDKSRWARQQARAHRLEHAPTPAPAEAALAPADVPAAIPAPAAVGAVARVAEDGA
jgi:hypothetical protein